MNQSLSANSPAAGPGLGRGAARCAPRVLALACVLLALPACGTPRDPHVITLRNGQVMHSTTRPELDQKTGYFRFLDRNQKDVLLRPDEVTMIERF